MLDNEEAAAVVRQLESRVLAGPELEYDEIKLLQLAVFDGQENTADQLQAMVENATEGAQLERIIEFATFAMDYGICLAYPAFARLILSRARKFGADCHRSIFRRLSHLPVVRSSTNGEPDNQWKLLVSSLEEKAQAHAADPELGPLYASMARHERKWCEHNRASSRSEDEMEE